MTFHNAPWIEALESRLLLSTITVTTFSDIVNASDGVTSLREAVLAANASAGDTDIVLAAGTYKLSIPDVGGTQENAGLTGDLDIYHPAPGTITIQGAGAGSTFIDANHLNRVLDIFGGGAVVLEMLTVENGLATASGASAAAMGGGVLATNSSLTLSGVTFLNNEARGAIGAGALGGGLCVDSGTVTCTGSTFQGSQANGGTGSAGATGAAGEMGGYAEGGGACEVNSTAAFYFDTFSTNTVTGGTGGAGGAGIVGLSGGAGGAGGNDGGGALFGTGGDIIIEGSSFTLDHATGGGGGVGGAGGAGLPGSGFIPGGPGGSGGAGGVATQGVGGGIDLNGVNSAVVGNCSFLGSENTAGGTGGNGGAGGAGGSGTVKGAGGTGGNGGDSGGATCPEYYVSVGTLTYYGISNGVESVAAGGAGSGGAGGAGNPTGTSGTTGSYGPINLTNQFLSTAATGTITGMAWNDANGNGVRDAGEQPLGGVHIGVTFGSGPQMDIYTGAGGGYSFTGPAGSATIQVSPAANYSLSPQNIGAANTDSDPNPITGLTGSITVPSGGTAGNIDIGMYNAIQYSGTTVDITGNDLINDQFTLAIHPGSFAVGLNNMHETISSTYNTLNFHGLGGTNSITITGGSAAETVNFTGTGGTITASGYTINLDTMQSQRFIGQANDIGILTTASATDTLVGRPTYSVMAGGTYSNRIDGSASVTATASGGTNTNMAYLYDSAGNDTFYATPAYAYLQGTGFNNRVNGFTFVNAYATAGGTDKAYLYDSAGNDTFYSTATYSYLKGTGFYNYANGFGSVYAYASSGIDTAYLYDTTGNDTYVGNTISGGKTSSYMQGSGLMHRATGFDNVYAYASTGTDTAYLYDSAGNDSFVGNTISGGKTSSYMSGSGLMDRATGFDKVYAYASTGTDTAYVYGTSGADQFHGRSNWGQLTQWPTSPTSYFVYFQGFDSATITSSSGSDGYDVDSSLLYPVTYVSPGHWKARAG